MKKTGQDSNPGVHFLLVRHGETTWNQERRWQGHADIPLSEVGIKQARSLALRLRKEGNPIAAVHASPLSRALRTADILAEELGLQSTPTPLWCEMNIGTWSGLTTEEVQATHAEEWRRVRAGEDLPRGGGETFAQFQRRVLRGARKLADRHVGERVVVVTHGGPIRAFLLHCQGLPLTRYREVDRIGNASLTEVTFQSGHAIIHRINDMAHLEDKTVSMEVVDA